MKCEYDKASWKHVGYQEGIEEGILQGEIKGRQEGLQQGFADGSYQKAIETATVFKRMGIDIEKIAEGTGLSKEAVEKLGVENPFYGERLLKISLRSLCSLR